MPEAKRASLVNCCPDDVCLEAPNAAAIVELRTRIDAGCTRAPIGNLTRVRGKPDVDIHVPCVVERDVLLGVPAADGKSGDDDLGGTRRLQLARRQLEAADVRRRGVIQIAVSQLETGTPYRPEFLADDIGFAVAVGIAQSDDPSRPKRVRSDLAWGRAGG